MSKLIYAPEASVLENTYEHIKSTDLSDNTAFHSIAFTGDGYMYTHGKKFRLFLIQNDGLSGVTFSVTNGNAQLTIDGVSMGFGTVVQSVSQHTDGIVTATTLNGAVTIGHKEYISSLTTPTLYGSATKIPIITVDKYGHITAVSNSAALDFTKVLANTITKTGNYYLIGVTGNTSQNPGYNTNTYIDKDGNLHAATLYQGNTRIADAFAPANHTSVTSTDSTLGHVKLFDSASSENDKTKGFAATPKAVYDALEAAKTYTKNQIAAQDAMIFAGTIEADTKIMSHNPDILPNVSDGVSTLSDIDYKVGYSFRVTTAGTFGTGNTAQKVEPGDMIIALNDKGNNFSYSDWTIIQTNIDGALTSNTALSGLLYANNSRTIQALALSNGILKYNGTSLEFVNPNTLWRTIKVNDTSIGTNELNLKTTGNVSYTVNNGVVTLSVNDANIIASASSLTVSDGTNTFTYSPSSAATIYVGNKLKLTSKTVGSNTYSLISHDTVSSAISSKLGKITTDAYGHVTSITEVTSLKNPNSLTIKNNDGTNVDTYDGSIAKSLQFLNGTDISFTIATADNNNIKVTPAITHKYRPVSFYATENTSSASSLLANSSSGTLTLKAGENITITNTENGNSLGTGVLKISSLNTWRSIEAYSFSNNVLSRNSIGAIALKFDDSLILENNEIGICWTEIDANGNATYVK